MRRSLLVCVLWARTAYAHVPQSGEQHDLLIGCQADIMHARNDSSSYTSCCSMQDVVAVEERTVDGHYEVMFPPAVKDMELTTGIPGTGPEPGKWYPVDDRAVLKSPNPCGVPVAWWYAGRVLCFWHGTGI